MSESLGPHRLTVACQGPLSMEFSRQEYWSGLPFPSPGVLPDPGSKLESLALAGRFFFIFLFFLICGEFCHTLKSLPLSHQGPYIYYCRVTIICYQELPCYKALNSPYSLWQVPCLKKLILTNQGCQRIWGSRNGRKSNFSMEGVWNFQHEHSNSENWRPRLSLLRNRIVGRYKRLITGFKRLSLGGITWAKCKETKF